jgi:hypothetical protein
MVKLLQTFGAMPEKKYENWNKSLRLTFSYEGSNIKLILLQKVNIIPPPSDQISSCEDYSGFWYTLNDANGRPLYRRITQYPFYVGGEVFTEKIDGSIYHREVKDLNGIFVILVPDISEGYSVAVFSSQTDKNGKLTLQPASELARFTLHSNPHEIEVKE